MKLERLQPLIAQKLQEENNKLLEAEIELSQKADKELLASHRDIIKGLRELSKQLENSGKTEEKQSVFYKLLQDKLEPLKHLGKPGGILRAIGGIAKPGSLTSAIFNTIADKREEKATRAAGEARFISTVVKGTEAGRQIEKERGTDAAIQYAKEKLLEKQRLEKEIEQLKHKESLLTSKEIKGSGLSKEDKQTLIEKEKQLKTVLDFKREQLPAKEKITTIPGSDTVLTQNTTNESISKPEQTTNLYSDTQIEEFRNEIAEGIKEGFREEFDKLTPEEKKSVEENQEAYEGALEAALEDVKKLSREQLVQLKKIASILDETKEESFEKALDRKPLVSDDLKQVETPKKEETKSLFKNMLDIGSNVLKRVGWLGRIVATIGSVGGAMKSLAGTALSVMGSLGLRAAAGAGSLAIRGVGALTKGTTKGAGLLASGVGYVGSKAFGGIKTLSDKLFNRTPSITGTSIVDKTKSIFGSTTDKVKSFASSLFDRTKDVSSTITNNNATDKLTTVANTTKESGGVLKQAGKFAAGAARFASKLLLPVTAALGAVDGIQGAMNAEEILGIKDRSATIGERAIGAVGGIASGLTGGLINPETIAKPLNNLFERFSSDNTKLVERSNTDREKMSRAVESITESIAEYETQAIKPVASQSVVGQNTVITNNQNVNQYVRPVIRNPDPSYLKTLDRNFVY